MIDIHDLPPEEAKLVEEFVEFLRNRQRKEKRKEPLNFATWPLGVKGKLTRKEIYDYL
jgi:hypothetical protein